MVSYMRCISVIARCAIQYRADRLTGSGIGGTQCPYILHICGTPGMTQEQLARAIYVNKSNVTRQLNQLEESGMIERRCDEIDRRVTRVYPTQKALELLPAVRAVMHQWNETIIEPLTEDERETLCALLERVMTRAKDTIDEMGRESCTR